MQSGLLSISAGLLLLLLASGCGAPASNMAPTALPSTATPTLVAVVTPSQPAAQASATPLVSGAEAESAEEYDTSQVIEYYPIQDAVRAQLASTSFRISHEQRQIIKNASHPDITHLITATAELVLPRKMHLVMVRDVFLPGSGPVSEAIFLEDVEYRWEKQEDESYRWKKSAAPGSPLDLFGGAYTFWDRAHLFTLSGTELVDGRMTEVYEFVHDRKGAMQADKVWVSTGDGLLRKIEQKSYSRSRGQKGITHLYNVDTYLFYDYNADIRIEAPTDDE